MLTKYPDITNLALKEAMAEVKLTAPIPAIIGLGGPLLTIGVTWIIIGNPAISAICGIGLILTLGTSVFICKLITLPRRLLKEAIDEQNALKLADMVTPPVPHDIALFKQFTTLITNADLDWLGGFHFGDYIPRCALTNVRKFYVEWDKPRHTFVSVALNAKFDELKQAAETFNTAVVAYTIPSNERPDYLTVRTHADPTAQSPETKAEIKEMNDAATHFVDLTIEFQKLGLQNGFTFP